MLTIAPPTPTLKIAPGLREFQIDLYAEALRKAAGGQTVAIYQLLKGGINQGADRPIEIVRTTAHAIPRPSS